MLRFNLSEAANLFSLEQVALSEDMLQTPYSPFFFPDSLGLFFLLGLTSQASLYTLISPEPGAVIQKPSDTLETSKLLKEGCVRGWAWYYMLAIPTQGKAEAGGLPVSD